MNVKTYSIRIIALTILIAMNNLNAELESFSIISKKIVAQLNKWSFTKW
jgi:hypothetical protein